MDAQGDRDVGRAALAKTSWRLLPLIGLGYGVAYMDRANISFASLQMNLDLGVSATVYGLGAGLFFVSYAILEAPSNMLLVRFGARRWIARIMLTWGVLAIGMTFVSAARSAGLGDRGGQPPGARHELRHQPVRPGSPAGADPSGRDPHRTDRRRRVDARRHSHARQRLALGSARRLRSWFRARTPSLLGAA